MNNDDTYGGGNDRVQYVTINDELLNVVESSMAPEKHEFVHLNDEEWQVYHVAHTVEEGNHIATVFVWQPDEGWSDEIIEQAVRDTLKTQRRKESERVLNADTDTPDL